MKRIDKNEAWKERKQRAKFEMKESKEVIEGEQSGGKDSKSGYPSLFSLFFSANHNSE